MKIAFNMISASHGGGFETYNKNILDKLFEDKLSDQYYIFTNKKSLESSNRNINFIYISNFFSKTIPRLFWMQFIFPFYLLFKKFDIIFSPMNIMPILLKFFSIKKVLVVHSNLPWLFPKDVPGNVIKKFFQKFLTNISINIADQIIVDSKTANLELNALFNKIEDKTSAIYLGVKKSNNSFLEPKHLLNINNLDILNDDYLLTISSSVSYHCILELISAYELYCNENENKPNYLILSKNLDKKYFEKVKKKINTSEYSSSIILIEDIESHIIPLLYENAVMYIFSSYCEVFGLTNLEAMLYETPVITANKSALPEICGDAALYFDPLDPKDIKDKINIVISNNQIRGEMIRLGNDRVQKFDWSKTYDKTQKIILN
jgi:glycosyltransferase involved in cell wall biosynthesis